MGVDFLEKTLEEIVFENKDTVKDRGFMSFYQHTFRQYYLPSGKKIDIFSYEIVDNILYFRIVELKKECLNYAAFKQIMVYFFEVLEHTLGHFSKVEGKLTLVGKILDTDAFLLSENGGLLEFYLYKYTYDGIYFKKVFPHSPDEPPMPETLKPNIQFCEKLSEGK